MKTWLISASVATAIFTSAAHASGSAEAAAGEAATGDAKAGETKVTTCLACHGPNGNSVVPTWPKLAGQHEEYIYKQLTDFKSGERKNAQMSPQVIPLNEQDFRDIAAYYSSQQQAPGTADPELAKQGEQLYRGGNPETGVPACSGCHGPAGMGTGVAKFPRISGQHAQYVDSSVKNFREGERANDPNGMMRGVASGMTDQEIAAVSQYVQGLKR